MPKIYIGELIEGEQFTYCGDIYEVKRITRDAPWPSPRWFYIGPPGNKGEECRLPFTAEVIPIPATSAATNEETARQEWPDDGFVESDRGDGTGLYFSPPGVIPSVPLSDEENAYIAQHGIDKF